MPPLVQYLEALRKSFDAAAASYDSVNDTLAQRVHAFVNRSRIVQALESRPVSTVLDAGGGTGTWAILLADMGLDVTLVDISPASVRVALQKAHARGVKLKALVANLEKLELSSSSFDFILSQGPLSLTPRPDSMLAEMHRVLKPGGLLWAEFYNAPGWALENTDLGFKHRVSMADETVIQMADWDYPARLFSIRRVHQMCQNAELKVLKLYGSHVMMSSLGHERAYAHQVHAEELEQLKAMELELGTRADCIGMSKIVQVLATRS